MIITYRVEGMHCPAYIKKIKSALSAYIKVISITLDPPLLQAETETIPVLDELNAHLSVIGNGY